VTFLLEKKAQVTFENKQGSTLLHVASINGHANIVELLLGRPEFMMAVPINEQDNDGATSLFLAAQNGHASVVDLLLKNFASAEIRDASGMSPLDVAIKNEHHGVIKILTEHLKGSLRSFML
jgi:ankyrin repeat protein